MRSLFSAGRWSLLVLLPGLACGPVSPPASSPVRPAAQVPGTVAAPPVSKTVELNLLFVHGVLNCDSDRRSGDGALASVEAELEAALPARKAAWEAAHPGFTLQLRTARANLYTAAPSPFLPAGMDPVHMDDLTVGSCGSTRQGEPCTTAFEWRYRLVGEIHRLFPEGAKNILLIGHSTGARTSYEVAANVGPDGVGTHDWGLQSRILGVVSINGMVDRLGSSKYSVVVPSDFETACKSSSAIFPLANACGLGNGWCEYAARISGFPAADWVAENKDSLALIASGSCGASPWYGQTDGVLPYDAQGSPQSPGLDMTPAGGTYRPAHGTRFGSFCHADVTVPGSPAALAATGRILDRLFTNAPRVLQLSQVTTQSLAYQQSTPDLSVEASCLSGGQGPTVEAVGVCQHPGLFNGSDHPIAASELHVHVNGSCAASLGWMQDHDPSNSHTAILTWKSMIPSPGGLLEALAR